MVHELLLIILQRTKIRHHDLEVPWRSITAVEAIREDCVLLLRKNTGL